MFFEITISAALGISAYSLLCEPRRFRIHRRTINLPGRLLPPLTILHLSDFHFYHGRTARVRFLHSLAAEPVDFIFITGDLIDDDSGIDLCLQALRPLQARYGIYCVFGNHDYVHIGFRDLFHRTGAPPRRRYHFNDVNRLMDALRDMGITVLQNERTEVNVEGTVFTIAGIDDPYLYRDDIAKTFDGYEKENPCFVLVHTPDRYAEISAYHPVMVFSGHTHGGQVCLPFVGPIVTRTTAPRQFTSGLVRMNGSVFHTTRGVGSGRLTRPRLFCPPEVTFFHVNFRQSPDH
ncbi:MAG: hypothetical protein C4527_08690 [Candidatus Omnitrophota bacterium]|jgi:predicted MPP superfamily phosphohydrolase|nr:MAG: hypothetical protein C4527_08690 [Candidatus Omnitrophota bacterium]